MEDFCENWALHLIKKSFWAQKYMVKKLEFNLGRIPYSDGLTVMGFHEIGKIKNINEPNLYFNYMTLRKYQVEEIPKQRDNLLKERFKKILNNQ